MSSSTSTTPISAWLESLRPRTLPLAFASIVVGSAIAAWHGSLKPEVALLALLTAGLLQILPTWRTTTAMRSKAAIKIASGRCAACKRHDRRRR